MSSDNANRRKAKPNVSKACVNCRKAHLACNEERPCRRCVSLSKQDTCFDVDHKKRGRPKSHPNKPKPPKTSSYFSLPIIHPYSAQSSFKMTDNSHTSTPIQNTAVATILLTMDLCCARLSDEINDLLGYYPQEMTHRSLYDFLAADSNDSLSRIHRHLLDNVVYTAQKVDPHYQYIHTPPTERSTSDKFFEENPQVLCSIANGSQSFTGRLYLRNNNGNIECLQSQFCLGGGLGADLLNPSTLGSLYIICLLSKVPDVPLSTPSPSTMSTSSLTEQQPPPPPPVPVPLIPSDQWDLPYSESPPPIPPQPIQRQYQPRNQSQPQPQPQSNPLHQLPLHSQSQSSPQHTPKKQPQQQQQQQQQQQHIPQHYPPHHQPPQVQSQPPGNFGFMNSPIPFIEHRGSAQEDSSGYSLPQNASQIESNSTDYTDTSMTNSAIKEESSALSCPLLPISKVNNNNSNSNSNISSNSIHINKDNNSNSNLQDRFKKNIEKKYDSKTDVEFYKQNSVVHVAPISNRIQGVFSHQKPLLFENQTSTLFRALNEISIEDNNRTGFMRVEALLT